MGSNSTFGDFGRRAVAWLIIAVVAIVALKIVISIVAGLVATLFSVVLLVALGFGVVWALRHL
jgi:hypothetical protein